MFPIIMDNNNDPNKVKVNVKRQFGEKHVLGKTLEELAKSGYDEDEFHKVVERSGISRLWDEPKGIERKNWGDELLATNRRRGRKRKSHRSYCRSAKIDPVDEIYVEDIALRNDNDNGGIAIGEQEVKEENQSSKRKLFVWPDPPVKSKKNTVVLQRGQLAMGSLDAATMWDEKYANGVTPYEVSVAECGRDSLPVSADLYQNREQAVSAMTSASQSTCGNEENFEDGLILKDLLSKCWSRALNRAGSSFTVEVESGPKEQLRKEASSTFVVPVIQPKIKNKNITHDDSFRTDLSNLILKRKIVNDSNANDHEITDEKLKSLYTRCSAYSLGWRDFVDGPIDESFLEKDINAKKWLRKSICYCTFCDIDLFSPAEAFIHFFGRKEHMVKVRGDICDARTQSKECAAKIDAIIQERQAALFNSVLQKEAEVTIDGLLHTIFMRASLRVDKKGTPIIKDRTGKVRACDYHEKYVSVALRKI